MKLAYATIAILTIALLLTGCATNTGDSTPRKLTDYVGGTGGLSIEFEEDAPPEEVFDDGEDDVFIALKVENEGEYTIKEGGIIASLSGISKTDFSLSSLHKKSNFDLERTRSESSGGIDTIDFGDASYKVDLKSDFSTKLIADVCYDYRTVAAAAICLKKDTRQHKTADACKITNEDIPFENSAAPIQITDVDEASSGSNKIKLNFVVENKETGWFYKPGTFKTQCIPDDAKKEENYIFVEINDPANRLNFKCSALGDDNKGEIRMYDGKKQISCTLDTNGLQETAYEQPIDITVDYMYRGAVETPITIKNADVY